MAKHSLVIESDQDGLFFLLIDGGVLTVGSDPARADFVARDLHVSRISCEIEVANERVLLEEPAAEGETANEPGKTHDLPAGADLRFGRARIRLANGVANAPNGGPVQVAARSDSAAPQPRLREVGSPDATRPNGKAAPVAADGKLIIQLVVIDGADQGRAYTLNPTGATLLGKSHKHADICLNDFYVARVHCELQVENGEVSVVHREGPNGTLLNGQRISERQALHVGDVLRVGNSRLRLELRPDDGSAEPPRRRAESEQPTEGPIEFARVGIAKVGVAKVGIASAAVEEVDVGEAAEEPGPQASEPLPLDGLLAIQNQLLGHYQVQKLLGRGHSGLVFHAHDRKTGHEVALKVFSLEFPSGEAELQSFMRVLKSLALLRNPHLVTVLGAGRTGAYCWIAREYVAGESLADLVARLTEESKLGWKRACRIAVHLAKALDYLERHKTPHGNITPANILIADETRLTKIADLLLDKALADSVLLASIGESKRRAERAFLAPEQTAVPAAFDHRSDLFALGAVLHYVLTGEPPAVEPSARGGQGREPKLSKPSKLYKDMPTTLEAAVFKLLAPRPQDRFQTAAELLEVIEPIVLMHDIKV